MKQYRHRPTIQTSFLVKPEPWMADASCQHFDREWWFPGRGDYATTAKAVAICNDCPVRVACLEYALSHNERHGVWGGRSERQRRRLRAQRKRAA